LNVDYVWANESYFDLRYEDKVSYVTVETWKIVIGWIANSSALLVRKIRQIIRPVKNTAISTLPGVAGERSL
jgi:hypothetical protein